MATTKVMISLSAQFLRELDRAARAERRNRSELVREAVRYYLHTKKAQRVPGANPRVQHAIATQEALAKQLRGKWDSTEEIRRWRETRP